VSEHYWFWLALISAAFLLLEAARPWRRGQRTFRRGLLRDLAFLALNGHFFGLWTATLRHWFWDRTEGVLGDLDGAPMAGVALPVQFVVFLLVYDFLDWCVHNLLHRVPFLWQFHKVHHSIDTMDWVGNFHFHWVEILVYTGLKAIPLALLGADHQAAFWVFVAGTAWGHFNHSNLDLGLGRLGYVFNSPRMHLWHHDASAEGGTSKNFAVVFSLWDHVFGTAFWPRTRSPERIGYRGDEEMPRGLLGQLLWPLPRLFARQSSAPGSAGPGSPDPTG